MYVFCLTYPGSVTGLQLADLRWGRTISRFIHMMCSPDVLYIAMYCIVTKQWDLFFDDGLPDKTPTNGMLAVDRTDTVRGALFSDRAPGEWVIVAC